MLTISKPLMYGLLGIGLLGLGLRLVGIDFGLPMHFHPDEPSQVETALDLFYQEDLNPHFFNYPTFHIYLLYLINWPFMKLSWAFPFGQEHFYLLGRLVSAVMGFLTLGLCYLMGQKATGKPLIGLGACLLLAIFPLHVINSHYATVDVALTFWVSLACLCLLWLGERGGLAPYLTAGLLMGLATSTKYNGAILLMAFLTAHVLRPEPFKGPSLLKVSYGIVAMVVAFMVTSPYVLLDYSSFLRDFSYEVSHMRSGHGVAFIDSSPGWLHHLTTLRADMGLGLLALAAFGMVLGLVERSSRMATLILLSWLLPYYLVIGSWQTKFDRYLLPLLPHLCIFAAMGDLHLSQRLSSLMNRKTEPGRSRLVFALLLVPLSLVPLSKSLRLVGDLTKEDTRTIAFRWIEKNLPSGDTLIVREQYTPEAELSPLGFKVINLATSLAEVVDPEFLRLNKVDFVLISSYMYDRFYEHPAASAHQLKVYEGINEWCQLIKTIEPNPDHPGPTIKIYECGGRGKPLFRERKRFPPFYRLLERNLTRGGDLLNSGVWGKLMPLSEEIGGQSPPTRGK